MNPLTLYKKYLQSVKSKLIVNVILIHAILMSLIVYDLIDREKVFMQKQLSQKGYELSSILASNASSSLLNNDLVALDELLFDMNHIKDHYMIFILDKNGVVRASTNKEYFNRYLDDKVSQEIFTKLLDNNLEYYQKEHDHLVDTLHVVKVKNNLIGYTRTLIDNSAISDEMEILTNKGLLYIFFAILIGAFFAWLSIRKITDRLNRVADAAQKISNKEFDVELPSDDNKDEVSKMIEAFNVMSKSIHGYIYELKQSSDKLKNSEVKLLEAQAIAHIGSWDLDLKTSAMQWSPELYNIYKKDMKNYEPTLNKFLLFLDEENKNKVNSAIKEVVSTAQRIELGIKINLDDGSVKYVHITGIASYDKDGNADKITGTTQDVTQHKEDEFKIKAREKQLFMQSRLAQMGEMISMIAHQWRQPLSAIAATTMNMKIKMMLDNPELDMEDSEKESDNPYMQGLNDIENYIQSLSKTINDFRNFYKSNKEAVKINIDTVIKRALNIIKTSLENENIELVYEDNAKEEIYVIDGELMQVILNIMKNAQDNFKEKDIKNRFIKIVSTDNTIEIYDNGGGIPEDIIDDIFKPYFSSKDDLNGTGLGLYMSKTIVEDHHNGVLKATNKDKGVSFYIELNK